MELQKISVTSQTLASLSHIVNIENKVNSKCLDYKKKLTTPVFQELKNLIRNSGVVENATRWLSNQLKIIDRDPHPHDLAAVAFSLQVI